MPTHLEWPEIALRLALAFVAATLIGLDRSEYGHPAGLRTTLLVCLAATIAMVQVNVLLNAAGRRPDSFIMLDLMRLPLGILSGIGFIGAGAILRKGALVQGITTAATIWFVTVMGLCFGGGQIGLGLASLALGLVVLRGMKWLERRLREQKLGSLITMAGPEAPTEDEIRAQLAAAGMNVIGCAVRYTEQGRRRRLCYSVRYHARSDETHIPPMIVRLAREPGMEEIEWCPHSTLGEMHGDEAPA